VCTFWLVTRYPTNDDLPARDPKDPPLTPHPGPYPTRPLPPIPGGFLETLTLRASVPPLDPDESFATLRALAASIEAAEERYRDGLRKLAGLGATPEQICTVAIDNRVRRFPTTGPGSWGATAMDLARAAVEALRVTGYLPTDPAPIDWSQVHDGWYPDDDTEGETG